MSFILKVALPCPLRFCFDYLPDQFETSWQKGIRVKVPFGSRELVGIVFDIKTVEDEEQLSKVKPIIKRLDEFPIISEQLLNLVSWVSDYYHHPVGDCFQVALPKKIRLGEPALLIMDNYWSLVNDNLSEIKLGKKQEAVLNLLQKNSTPLSQQEITDAIGNHNDVLKRLEVKRLVKNQRQVKKPVLVTDLIPLKKLNNDQIAAVNAVWKKQNEFSSTLLHGITGSGKTEVYIQLASLVVSKGKQVLILIPEIGLTEQFVSRFRQHLSACIVVFNSSMNDSERQQAWLLAQSGDADIVIGTRSAVFSPLSRLGLVVIDEEHDGSYKQQDSLRYHARNVAIIRAKRENIPILLGSATPSLESYYQAQSHRYNLVTLAQRATGAELPNVKLIDISGPKACPGLSSQLHKQVGKTLEEGNQVLLFINQRGYAPVLICHDCTWQASCKYCDAKMIVHQSRYQLRCHHCGFNQPLLKECPECQSTEMGNCGVGTQQIEENLQTLFPEIPVLRIDRDSTQRVGSFARLIAEIQGGGAKILIGTQMLAKGHDFHDVTLVGVLDADQGLFSADFRATESLAQLITQVTGRAGRGSKPGKVYIQTSQVAHPFWQDLLRGSYIKTAKKILQERKSSLMPPIGSLCVIRARAKKQTFPLTFLTEVSALLNKNQKLVMVLGPVPAMMEKRAGNFRAQLLLTTQNRKALHQLLDHYIEAISKLKSSRECRWSIDVDPLDLY
jgi:primosomal protein N' (replication factor Y)